MYVHRELLARTNTSIGKVQCYEESPAMLAQKKKYARNLLALRPREISLEDASGLCVRSMDLFQWALDSSEEFFAVNELAKSKVSGYLPLYCAGWLKFFFCGTDKFLRIRYHCLFYILHAYVDS